MQKKYLIFITIIFLSFSLFAQNKFQNKRIVVLTPTTEGFSSGEESWIPSAVRRKIEANFYDYSPFVIVDAQNERTIKEIQAKSDSFSYDDDSTLKLGKLLAAEYALFSTITKANNKYILSASITDLTTGIKIASATTSSVIESVNLFEGAGCSANLTTVKLFEDLDIFISSVDKYELLQGNMLSEDEEIDITKNEIQNYKDKKSELEKQIVDLKYSGDLDYETKKAIIEAEKLFIEQQEKIAQAKLERLQLQQEKILQDERDQLSRTDEQRKKIQDLSREVEIKAAELRKTKINNLKSSSHGSVFDTITRATFDNIIVSLPPLPTQQKIANILSSLDDKIEVNRRINEQLEELAGALFKSWFVDFEPFKDGEFVDSELGMIPKGWKVGTLGELCITNKRTYGAKFVNEIAYLDTGSVTKNQIEGFQILNPEVDKIPSRARRAVTEGDILFSSVRPNQKHYAFLFAPQTNMVASTGFIVITANWSGYRYFIYQYLIQEEIIDKLQAIAEQSVSTYPSINASDITNLKLVIPPMDIIGKFAGMNLAFMSEIDKNQQEIHHLTTLRDTLLPKLMSGEIDVNEVKI